MLIKLHKYHPHDLIKSISKQVESTSKLDCLEQVLILHKKIGIGKISAFKFSDGVGLVLFDCTLAEDWDIKFIKDYPAPLQFNFNINGEIWHFLNDNNIQYHLNPLQNSITASPYGKDQVMKLPGKVKLLFAILVINRTEYLKKIECILGKMPPKLKILFEDKDAQLPFLYQGNYSLAAAEIIKKITNDTHTGLVRSTYIEGKSLELLARQIKQYKDDLLSPGRQVVLRKYDLEKIIEARDVLIHDFQNSPTIEELAKKVGINQQKLKMGFKEVFETTINKYLRNERLDQASLLLLQGYSVRDASTEVGYSNQSHFAERFREKYGVLPKDYLKNIRSRGKRVIDHPLYSKN